MTPIEIIRKYGVEYVGRFYSVYRGVVMDNEDETQRGRIQIHVPSIYGGINVWANPKSFGGGPKFGFKYLTPQAGEVVHIEFEAGDPLRALWSYHGWALNEKPEELGNTTLGFITPNGNKVLLEDVEGTLVIKTKGDVDIETEGNIKYRGAEIHLQDGQVGIPQTTQLVQRLEKIEKKLNLYIMAMKTSPPILSTDKGLTFKEWLIGQVGDELDVTTPDDIQSKTIKQPE